VTEHRIINGDVLDGLRTLPDGCVQCTVTSPPYFALRDYGVDGQIGLEATPEEFIDTMVRVFREVRRVTRSDGVLWLNLGDSYSGSGKGPTGKNGLQNAEQRMGFDKSDSNRGSKKTNLRGGAIPAGLKPKDLIGIPWRVAFALQTDGAASPQTMHAINRIRAALLSDYDSWGEVPTNTRDAIEDLDREWEQAHKGAWYFRSAMPWIKRNCMPESTTDRPTSAIEYIFLMTKSAKYFYDGEAIRVPSSESYQNDVRPQGVLRQKVNKRSKYPDAGQFKKQDQTGNPTYTGFNERWAAGKGNRKSFRGGGKYTAGQSFDNSEPVENETHGNQPNVSGTRNYRNSDPFFESWQGLYSESENPLAFIINPQSRPELHFACVDDQTEALTTSGWKGIHALKDGEQIVGFDGVALSWQEATFHRYPFSGKMVVASSRDLSMWLTPNHRVVCRDYGDKGEWKIKQADKLKGYEEIPTSAPFECDTYGELINKDVAELAGWVLTDGSYNHKKCKIITLYQTEGRGKTEQIDRIFKSLSITPKIYRRKKIDRWDQISYSFGGEVAKFIREVFPLKEGNFGILSTWSDVDLRALWKGMTEGDGNQRKDGRVTFVGNRSKVDFYQALCVRLGMTCRISFKHGNAWAAFVTKKHSTTMRGTNGKTNTLQTDCFYDGIVWCPSVRSGMWLARRNGRPFITGNTFPDLLAATCIKAGTSEYGCCPKCGAPYQRIVEASGGVIGKGWHPHADDGVTGQIGGFPSEGYTREFKGWQPTCKCGKPLLPGQQPPEALKSCLVLDPFMGSGTVAVVARDLNRSSIGCEINPEYVKIIRARLQADSQLDTGVVSYLFEKVPA